jgi:hypothetical protein
VSGRVAEEFPVKISATRHAPEAQLKTEVDIEATADELTSLYKALGTLRAELPAGDASVAGSPEPHDCLLTAIEIQRVPGMRLRVSVDWDRRVLQIVGGDSETQSFAANVLDLARETPVGSRHNFDYFDNHFYLDPESVSLGIQFV